MKDDVLETLGSPLVQVKSPPGVTVAAKLEARNPGGSAKDRPALAMIEAAEAAGALDPGGRIVEPTSGNTGIGLAMAAAAKGYEFTAVIPETKSEERRRLMRAYGADIELVDGDIETARRRADELEAETGAVQLHQFENPANPRAHYETTGAEILEQVGDRRVDALVAGVGTGGTLTGVGRRLKEAFPELRIVAVEPADNAVLSGGPTGADGFQGMGPGFVSENLDTALIDSVETVTLDAAERECRRLAREEGILVGQSSGASNLAARRVAADLADPTADCPPSPGDLPADEPAQRRSVATDGGAGECPLVVTVFWDSGERYLSTGMFDADEG